MTGDATAQRFRDALEAAVSSERADAILTIFGDPIEHAAETAAYIKSITDKPVLAAFLGGGEVQKREVPQMNAAGVPVFPTPERAVRALGALLRTK